MGNLDLQGFGSSLEDSDIRFAPEESSLDVLPHELINNASINSRDMSMISASGASSQGNSGQQNPAVAGSSNSNHNNVIG